MCIFTVKAIVCSQDKVPFLFNLLKSGASSYFKYIIAIDGNAAPDAPTPEGSIKFSEIVSKGKVGRVEEGACFFYEYVENERGVYIHIYVYTYHEQ
jgi:hypothetical protein